MSKMIQTPLALIVFFLSLSLLVISPTNSESAEREASGKFGCPGSYVQKVRPNGYLEMRDTRYRFRNYESGSILITGLDYYDAAGNFLCSDPNLPLTVGPHQTVSVQAENCVPFGKGNFQAIVTSESSGRGASLEAIWEIHVHDDNEGDFEYRKTTARHSGTCKSLN